MPDATSKAAHFQFDDILFHRALHNFFATHLLPRPNPKNASGNFYIDSPCLGSYQWRVCMDENTGSQLFLPVSGGPFLVCRLL